MLAAGLVLLLGAGLLVGEVIAMDLSGLGQRYPLAYLVLGTWIAAGVVGAGTYAAVRYDRTWRAMVLGPVGPFAVFSVGAALLAPITIHLFVMTLTGSEPRAFTEWAGVALPITSLAHITFATMVGWRAVRLARGRTDAPTVGSIFRTTVVVSAIPFGLLLFLPPVLVALTGLPLLPLLYGMEKYATLDRGGIMLPVARLA